MFITIPRLLHHLRIHTPHTAYIGGNLTSRAHQFDPKRCMPSNVSRMTQNIVINSRQDLAQTHRHYINLLRCTPYITPFPTYAIIQLIEFYMSWWGGWRGGHGPSILVRPVHVLGGISRVTREAAVRSNISPVAAIAAVAKP